MATSKAPGAELATVIAFETTAPPTLKPSKGMTMQKISSPRVVSLEGSRASVAPSTTWLFRYQA